MKKIILSIFCLMFTCSVFALSSTDKVLDTKTNEKGISYSICQDADEEIFLLVTDKASKKTELKVKVDAIEDVQDMICKIDSELNAFKRTPLKKLIKSYKKQGSWEKYDDGKSYFELDDDDFKIEDVDDDTDDESDPDTDDTDDESDSITDDTDDDSDDDDLDSPDDDSDDDDLDTPDDDSDDDDDFDSSDDDSDDDDEDDD